MNSTKNIDSALESLKYKILGLEYKRASQKQEEERNEKELEPQVQDLKLAITNLTLEHIQPLFKQVGEEVIVVDSDKDAKLSDNFIELLFYPKGFSREVRGVNTAAIRFIFSPKDRIVRVLQRNSLFPLPLKEATPIALDEHSINTLSSKTIEFAQQVADNQ